MKILHPDETKYPKDKVDFIAEGLLQKILRGVGQRPT